VAVAVAVDVDVVVNVNVNVNGSDGTTHCIADGSLTAKSVQLDRGWFLAGSLLPFTFTTTTTTTAMTAMTAEEGRRSEPRGHA